MTFRHLADSLEFATQAAQATFKSIKSVVPLLDRVLVQRFKADTVRVYCRLPRST